MAKQVYWLSDAEWWRGLCRYCHEGAREPIGSMIDA